MRTALIGTVLASALLAGCAPGDPQLSPADLASRDHGVWLDETAAHTIPYHGRATYSMACLDGTVMDRASAHVSNVAGTWNRPQDYRLTLRTEAPRGPLVAVVEHVGQRHLNDAPWVVVRMKARCTAPARR